MIARATRTEKFTRRRRERPVEPVARPARAHPPAEPTPTERRDVDPTEDTAVYNCGCGMVFEAPVSTSVGCPHCGASQAW
jgi:hypothetical protein